MADGSDFMSWEPLPPRGETSNLARRRQRRQQRSLTLQATASDPFPKDSKQYPKPNHQRRPNRPGSFNSYLKVQLDDGTIGKLHQMAVQVQRRIQQNQQSVASNDNDNNNNSIAKKSSKEEDPPAKKIVAKPLRFKPRSQASLHMTLFFGGETLCKLPANELQEWHSRVSQRFHASGFCLQGSHPPISTPSPSDCDFSFQVTGLKVFPPQRNNLIVAILEPAPDWHTLYGDLRVMAKDESLLSPALAEIVKRSKAKWIAHLTLGNLIGGHNRAASKALSPLLDEVFSEGTDGGTNGIIPASTSGITMGGPIPEQVVLDWDFRYTPN